MNKLRLFQTLSVVAASALVGVTLFGILEHLTFEKRASAYERELGDLREQIWFLKLQAVCPELEAIRALGGEKYLVQKDTTDSGYVITCIDNWGKKVVYGRIE